LPRPILNISQDLNQDLNRVGDDPPYRLLFQLIEKPSSAAAVRVLAALRWYNSAHRESTDEFAAIVHLAIAFEALLGLPQSEKTERLVDSISLLLGRLPRLDAWARQFYEARSRIVHEGFVEDPRFVATSETRKEEGQRYQSLFSYGTQVFRLCLRTSLVGLELSEDAGLEDRLVTNQERFTKLCALFTDSSVDALDRLRTADQHVTSIERFCFVAETGLRLETMISAVRHGVRALLESQLPLDPAIAAAYRTIAKSNKSAALVELERVRKLNELLPDTVRPDAGDVVRRLVKTVWGIVFMHYYWLKKQEA
jgi:hypothetical protein